ncbi:MAG: RloB family protein [Pseudomonadota bacterium]
MGKDHQPKHRQQARDLKRRSAQRAPFERVLIVCEGEKTEPQYIDEIKREHRLNTANVQVWASALGTNPSQVVTYAEDLFNFGDRAKAIEPRSFDRVMAVFDRDDHPGYHQALTKAAALNGKLINDENEPVAFAAIASVPCFELWLLLHFKDVQAPFHRNEIYAQLNAHVPGYEKGQDGHWAATKKHLEIAVERAQGRVLVTTAYDGREPYTAMHELVLRLVHLKD